MNSYLSTQVTDLLAAQLRAITRDDGSRTDIGRTVFVSARRANAHDAPCCVLTEGPERGLGRQAGLLATEITYTIDAIANRLESVAEDHATPSAEYAVQGNMIADIREKIEPRWCPLSSLGAMIEFGGATRNAHEDAGELTGVSVTYTVNFQCLDGDFGRNP